jgi:hypothetical protein
MCYDSGMQKTIQIGDTVRFLERVINANGDTRECGQVVAA